MKIPGLQQAQRDLFVYHQRFVIKEQSQIGDVRRQVQKGLRLLGGDADLAARASLIINELGTNLLRHAGSGGEILLRYLDQPAPVGVEILGLDRGPGISNVTQAMTDGFSTFGGKGIGLGSIRRQSDMFAIHSRVGEGTVVLSRVWQATTRLRSSQSSYQMGVISVAMPGQTACGDGWRTAFTRGVLTILMVDGLGHGPEAARAAKTAMRAFERQENHEITEMLQAIHEECHGTRGAAVAIVRIIPAEARLEFLGVGNISAGLVSAQKFSGCLSTPGIVGLGQLKLRKMEYPWDGKSLLVMHTDGLQTRWHHSDVYHMPRNPMIKAALFYRNFARGHDDATVMVLKQG
ncbi:MAG: stage II sporulation protein E [Calditrichaeota bacterium]|nr:MAG: stage II sporulation protein E [Calditrichota bacterium]